jgi:integrase/recombinase XerD
MQRRGKAKVPNESERKRLNTVTKAGNHAKRNLAVIAFSYRLGLRAKELAALRVNSVLDKRGHVVEQCLLEARMTKGGKPRVAYLSNPIVKSALKDYLGERQARQGVAFNRSAALFQSQQGDHFSARTMQQLLKRLHKEAGIDGRSHSGRRFFATELIAKGVDLKSVSTLMGHASVAMTAQYAEDNPQRLSRIAAELI